MMRSTWIEIIKMEHLTELFDWLLVEKYLLASDWVEYKFRLSILPRADRARRSLFESMSYCLREYGKWSALVWLVSNKMRTVHSRLWGNMSTKMKPKRSPLPGVTTKVCSFPILGADDLFRPGKSCILFYAFFSSHRSCNQPCHSSCPPWNPFF